MSLALFRFSSYKSSSSSGLAACFASEPPFLQWSRTVLLTQPPFPDIQSFRERRLYYAANGASEELLCRRDGSFVSATITIKALSMTKVGQRDGSYVPPLYQNLDKGRACAKHRDRCRPSVLATAAATVTATISRHGHLE